MLDAAEVPLFEAVIVPHRSLSRRGLNLLLAAICILCTANAAAFVAIGAWPVAGFTGIEMLLAAFLFRLNALAAKGSELVLLTPSGMRVIRVTPQKRRSEVVLPPNWLAVDLRERPGRVPGLFLVCHGREEEIGRALGDEEKRDLARALTGALHAWRHPVFDNPQLQV